MVSLRTPWFVCLCVAATRAQTLTGSCPSGQALIANNKCCPGYATSGSDSSTTYCCVKDITVDTGKCGATICVEGGNGPCKAKVAVTDPNYDDKVQKALSGTEPSSSSSSTTVSSTVATASAVVSSAAARATNTTSSDSVPGSATSTSTSSPPENGATSTKMAMLGMTAGLAAFSVVICGL